MAVYGTSYHPDNLSSIELERANRAKALEIGYKIKKLEQRRDDLPPASIKRYERITQEISQLRNIQIALGFGFIEIPREETPPKPPSKFTLALFDITSSINSFINIIIAGFFAYAGILFIWHVIKTLFSIE